MKIFFCSLLAVATVVVGAGAYLLYYGNVGALYNGCFFPYPGLRAVGDAQPHFKGFPPRYVCLYRTKAGRTVERPD